jgi:hypothetical protein
MRAALDEVMTKVPVDQATPGIKAYMPRLFEGCRGWPHKLRGFAGRGVGANSDSPVAADVTAKESIDVIAVSVERSRLLHAIDWTFIALRDNGHPNGSSTRRPYPPSVREVSRVLARAAYAALSIYRPGKGGLHT